MGSRFEYRCNAPFFAYGFERKREHRRGLLSPPQFTLHLSLFSSTVFSSFLRRLLSKSSNSAQHGGFSCFNTFLRCKTGPLPFTDSAVLILYRGLLFFIPAGNYFFVLFLSPVGVPVCVCAWHVCICKHQAPSTTAENISGIYWVFCSFFFFL